MEKYKADMYQKSIYDINYKKLKKQGIEILIYDFDNTIIEKSRHIVPKKLKVLFNDLKKDFKIIIISNTWNKKKIQKFSKECDTKYIMDARKPFSYGYKKCSDLKDIDKNKICMIGDQLLTDIWGAKRMGYHSVLVDPIHKKELFLTKINRFIENILYKKLNKKYKIKRGEYYD